MIFAYDHFMHAAYNTTEMSSNHTYNMYVIVVHCFKTLQHVIVTVTVK